MATDKGLMAEDGMNRKQIQRLFQRLCIANVLAPLLLLAAASIVSAQEEINLESTVQGNREQPRVLYIVPWQQPGSPADLEHPIDGLLDEVLAPLDREVFQRELKYFKNMATNEQNSTGSILTE